MNFGACFLDVRFVRISWPPELSHTIGAQSMVSWSSISSYYFLTCPKLHVDPADSPRIKSVKDSSVKHVYFLWLLDVHNVGQATGVPEDIFKEIFYTCAECGRYMTQRVSFNHHDDSDDWESSLFEDSLCIYLRGKIILELEGPAALPITE